MSVTATEISADTASPATASTAIRERHARFEQLVNEHIPALSRVAYRICSNRETAQDIVQETLLLAWRHFDRLKEPKAVKGWLCTILKNEHVRAFEKSPPPAVDIDVDIVASPEMAPDLDVQILRRHVGALPEKYRTPLMLYAFQGYEVNEISRSLGIKRATVKTRLFRAREKLRAEIERGAFFG